MNHEFEKDLFFIWDECAWRFQNGTGKNNRDEYATHIKNHGNLGKIYPKCNKATLNNFATLMDWANDYKVNRNLNLVLKLFEQKLLFEFDNA